MTGAIGMVYLNIADSKTSQKYVVYSQIKTLVFHGKY
jgi:hypothetical protein